MLDLALKRILHHKVLSSIITLAIALSCLIFLLLTSALDSYAERLLNRTQGNFLVAGRKGANVDLIMDSLYFRQGNSSFIQIGDLKPIREKAAVATQFNLYSVSGHALIGTEIEYFDLRQLSFASGGAFTQMGECILGHDVAKSLGLKVGDKTVTEPTNIFDPAGSTSVQLTVCGILSKTDSPDDKAIFTSMKTIWTVHGLGHSHSPETEGPDLGIKMIEFTPETLKTFHFHGDENKYPVTSALISPKSTKDSTMIKAEISAQNKIHVIQPEAGLRSFLNMIFQLDQLFSMVLILVSSLLFLCLILLIYLQLKLRNKEKQLLDRLGAEKLYFHRLICAEWVILSCAGLVIGYTSSIILNPIILELFDKINKG
ncbi:MAG: ABC transporter permease [Lentisphaerales bacterium]|nr:ABC transporter permease [Lentisphaerales bacterium]